MAVLEGIPGIGDISVEQYRLLSAMQKPIDIVLEKYGLLVEVDGSQHAQSSTGFGQAAGDQYRRDRQLDASVVSSGKALVRLHHQDSASWARHVHAAIQRLQQNPSSSFVYYSSSYPASRRV